MKTLPTNKKLSNLIFGALLTAPLVSVAIFANFHGSENSQLNPSIFSNIKDLHLQIFHLETNEKSELNQTEQNAKSNQELTLKGKLAKEESLRNLNVGTINQQELYKALVQRKVDVDPEMAERMKHNAMTRSDFEKLDFYAASNATEDENFSIEIIDYKNFSELKTAFDNHSKKTGQFYGNELLNQTSAYKGATFEDIKQLLDAGAVLPEDFISKAVVADNIELASQLKAAGYNINSQFVNKSSIMNALESQAESYAINPYQHTAEQQIATTQKLIDLGVPLIMNDETRDALDITLEGVTKNDEAEAGKLMVVAKHLHEIGIPLETSHQELLTEIKNKYPSLYDEYRQSFNH